MATTTLANFRIPIQNHLPVFGIGLIAKFAIGVFSRIKLGLAHLGGAFCDALASPVLFHVQVVGSTTCITGLFVQAKMGVIAALRGSVIGNATSLRSSLHVALLRKQFFEAGDSARAKPWPHQFVQLFGSFTTSNRKPLVLGLVMRLCRLAWTGDLPPENVNHAKDGFEIGHFDSKVYPVTVGVKNDRSLPLEQSRRVSDFFGGRLLRMLHEGNSTTPEFVNARIGGVK